MTILKGSVKSSVWLHPTASESFLREPRLHDLTRIVQTGMTVHTFRTTSPQRYFTVLYSEND